MRRQQVNCTPTSAGIFSITRAPDEVQSTGGSENFAFVLDDEVWKSNRNTIDRSRGGVLVFFYPYLKKRFAYSAVAKSCSCGGGGGGLVYVQQGVDTVTFHALLQVPDFILTLHSLRVPAAARKINRVRWVRSLWWRWCVDCEYYTVEK